MSKSIAEPPTKKRDRSRETAPLLPTALTSVIDAVLAAPAPCRRNGAKPPPATRRTPSGYAASESELTAR